MTDKDKRNIQLVRWGDIKFGDTVIVYIQLGDSVGYEELVVEQIFQSPWSIVLCVWLRSFSGDVFKCEYHHDMLIGKKLSH